MNPSALFRAIPGLAVIVVAAVALSFSPKASTQTFSNSVATEAAAPATVQLFNISTRLPVKTGDGVGIGGFSILQAFPQPLAIDPQVSALVPPGEPPGKSILVRALGPSLTSAGVAPASVLQDPTLELYDSSGNLLVANDNWRTSQQADIQDSGLAPTDDREAALIAALPAGQYTTVVRGVGGTTGIALVEAYDLDGDPGRPLVNVSTRGKVETAQNVLIGGLIAQGAGTVRFLFRGLGPELTAKGVTGALADPSLQLFDANGNALAANDNWKDTQQQEIAATGIAPTDDRESAILATLPAGAYTVVLSGKNNTSGIGLVEVYNLDPPSQ
jgi:hypothetical protein